MKVARNILIGVSLTFIVALTACGSTYGQATGTPGSSTAYPPIHLRLQSDRFEFDTPTSMCSAIMTAEVVVGSHGASHWNTVDGQRPAIADSKTIIKQGYGIYTPVQFSQFNVLLDHRKKPTKEFDSYGGVVGTDSLFVDPFPQVITGEHDLIVFGPGSLPAGQGTTEDWLVLYNTFPIDAQGNIILQPAGNPNEPGPGKPQPEVSVSLSGLTQELAGCR